ncbi:hypothetical protein QUF63_17035 [Anaerolineales bacterium HSG25]|nr:hypothetical protein [Anaerolineales bacterium HSG25]
MMDFGSYEGECQGCDKFCAVNDLGLCDSCASKLDRDLIRQRDWDYSALAFGLPVDKREALRSEIISKFGEKYELIAPPEKNRKKRKKRKKDGLK